SGVVTGGSPVRSPGCPDAAFSAFRVAFFCSFARRFSFLAFSRCLLAWVSGPGLAMAVTFPCVDGGGTATARLRMLGGRAARRRWRREVRLMGSGLGIGRAAERAARATMETRADACKPP